MSAEGEKERVTRLRVGALRIQFVIKLVSIFGKQTMTSGDVMGLALLLDVMLPCYANLCVYYTTFFHFNLTLSLTFLRCCPKVQSH